MPIERSRWRTLFPGADECLFMDHAGVAPISTRVRDAICRFASEASGQLHLRYPHWNVRAEEVRSACARLVGVEPRQVAFLKNTSEGLSFIAEGLSWQPGDAVIVADHEFPSNVYPWWGLRRLGVEVRMISPGPNGVDRSSVEAHLDERVRVVALSAIGYGGGDRLNLSDIADVCRRNGALFVVDGIQAIGAVAVDARRDGFDCIAADGHKWLCAPEGAGFMALSEDLLARLRPAQLGWKSVVNTSSYYPYDFRLRTDAAKLEAGSLNLLALHALGAAVELTLEVGLEEIEKRLTELTRRIEDGLAARGLRVLGQRGSRLAEGGPTGVAPPRSLSGIVTFVPRGGAERVRQELWARGVITKVRFGGIRLAPHHYHDDSDVERFFAALDEAEAAA